MMLERQCLRDERSLVNVEVSWIENDCGSASKQGESRQREKYPRPLPPRMKSRGAFAQ
jgi:hypothetical protein